MKCLQRICALLVLASACQRIDVPVEESEESEKTQVMPDADTPAFVHSDLRLSLAHSGIRKLEFASDTGPALFFRERIATDGHGRFSVEPVGPQDSSVADWNAFELAQHSREGFLFRYRDFVVRDQHLFETNWILIAEGDSEVAGRACLDYRVERTLGEPISFRISIDNETGLVLASHESDAAGRLVASMVYESFQLAPDLSAVAWHLPSNQESPLLSLEDLAAESGPLLEPRLMPSGYAPLECATVTDGDGVRWLKRTYSDGIEILFFLERLGRPPGGRPLVQRSLHSGSMPDSTSAVMVFKLGSATVIQGEVDGHELMAIGRAPEAELLDFIESSLP